MKKPYWLILLLSLTACTMTLSPNPRAKYVVKHYLDSINKPNKIELIKFIAIEDKDIDNSDIIKKIESDPIKTDSEKQANKKWLDTINNANTPNGFYCDYRINGIEHVSVIRLDTMLRRVIRVTEMH